MKKTISFLSALLGVTLFICCQQTITTRLDEAENLLDSRPDSALCILESIPSSELRSEESNARYALLRSIAYDKNYIDLQSDSIIRKATAFYSKQLASIDRMRAWYYEGVILDNVGDYPSSIISLEKAEHDALLLKNDYYLGMINREKGYVYNTMINMPSAIECQEKAIEAFRRAGKEEHAAFALLSLGIGWFNYDQFEKARSILLEAKNESVNTYLRIQADLRLAAIIIELNEDPIPALDVFKRTSLDYYVLTDYGYRAIAHERIGQLDSADYWLERGYQVAHSEADTAALDYMHSSILMRHGDYKEAYPLLKHATDVQDRNTQNILQESLNTALKEYYQESLALEKEREARERERRNWGIVISGLLLLSFIAFIVARIRKKNRLLELQMARYTAIQQDNRGIRQENARLIGALFSSRLHHLDELSDQFFSADEKKKKDLVFNAFKKYLDEFRNDQDVFLSLEEDLNRSFNGVFQKLISQVPDIDGYRRKIAALFMAGVPYETIQLIMRSVSIDSLRMIRSRLRKDIKSSQAADAELFLEMLETKKRPTGNKNK